MPPIAEKVLAFDNLGPKYRVIVRIGLRSPGPQRLQDRARGGNCGLTKQLACSGWEHGVIVLTGDPYDAAGQMPDLGAAAVLDKLDGLNQAREALLGRFRGWKHLGSFFYEYYHTHSAAESLGALCRLSEGVWRCH